MFWFLSLLCVLLLATNIVCIYYIVRFARIIFMVEDDMSEAIETFANCVKTFEKILGMQLFFDSPDVRPILTEALAEIKASKLAVQAVVQRFVERSKQKYVRVEENEEDEV